MEAKDHVPEGERAATEDAQQHEKEQSRPLADMPGPISKGQPLRTSPS